MAKRTPEPQENQGVVEILAAKLRGHCPCLGVSGNCRAINSYYRRVLELVRKWLNRRSQKRSMVALKLLSMTRKIA